MSLGHCLTARSMSSEMRLHEEGSISPSPSNTNITGCRGFKTLIKESTMALVIVFGFFGSRLMSWESEMLGMMLPSIIRSVLDNVL